MMDIVIDELPNYICYKLSRKVVQLVMNMQTLVMLQLLIWLYMYKCNVFNFFLTFSLVLLVHHYQMC